MLFYIVKEVVLTKESLSCFVIVSSLYLIGK